MRMVKPIKVLINFKNYVLVSHTLVVFGLLVTRSVIGLLVTRSEGNHNHGHMRRLYQLHVHITFFNSTFNN